MKDGVRNSTLSQLEIHTFFLINHSEQNARVDLKDVAAITHANPGSRYNTHNP